MNLDILETAKAHAESAEVFSQTSATTTVTFKANRCHSVETKLASGVGLRVIEDGRVGFASTTSPERVTEVVESALATAQFGELAGFELPPQPALPEPVIFDSRISLLPPDWFKVMGETVVGLCRELIPDLKADLTFRKVYSSIELANTRGFSGSYEKVECSLEFEGLMIVDSSLVWLFDFLNLSPDCHFNAEAFVRQLATRAELARRPARLATKNYPCIFTHMATLDLLSTLVPAVSGKSFEKGISPLIGKEQEKVLDEKLTIYDDGLHDFGFGSAPFDGEGIPRRSTPLFERGVFRNFLFDLKTAAATKRQSTGSAGRGYGTLPTPATSNLVVRPGRLTLEKAIASMNEGLVIYATVGGGQSNLLAGDFSLGINLGFKVERGEFVGRVKDAMIAGNIYEAGRILVGLGDKQFDFGNALVPFFYFPSLPVATRG